jgi:hypothetical protein
MPESLQASRDHVGRIVRDLLQSHFMEREVPSFLLDAVVDGKGEREAVGKATREACGPDKPFDLVLFDTDRIAEYVFESSRPPVIAGASLLLHELNKSISQDYDYGKWAIFSGGGEGLLLAPHGQGPRICQIIRDRYQSQTAGALSVTADFLEASPEDFLAARSEQEAIGGARLVSGTQAVLSRLRDMVRRRKDEEPPFREPVPGGEVRCASCRDRRSEGIPMPRRNDEGAVEGYLCSPCWMRWQKGRRKIEGVSFDDLVDRLTGAYPALGGKSRYLGFLYADGNAMGAHFGRLATLPEIRFTSLAVAHVFEAAQKQIEEMVRRLVSKVDKDYRLFLSYLGGGDEAIWILPGALAVHVAEQLSGWIEKEAGAIEGLPKITLGIGLVLCQHGYPVRYQYDLAKSLLKNAKSMFYGSTEVSSSLDFELLTDSSPLSDDLASARKVAYRTEEKKFFLTCRPYRADRFSALLERMRAAREKGVATSQLYALQTGAGEGRKVFLNYLRYQIARGLKSYRPWLEPFVQDLTDPRSIEQFFVDASGTWIADGLQLFPFLDQLKKLEDPG